MPIFCPVPSASFHATGESALGGNGSGVPPGLNLLQIVDLILSTDACCLRRPFARQSSATFSHAARPGCWMFSLV